MKICQLVKYHLVNVNVREAWTGPASLQLFQHSMAPVADLPVKRIVSAVHFISDMTIDLGEVVYDYLEK
jgi:acetoacetate decarboxylase